MHDDDFEMDEDGQLRRKKVARDRERITFATISDHAAYGFSRTFADGSVDHTSPHAPGYRFADINDAARLAAQDAYEERNRRMSTAWQRKGVEGQATPQQRTPSRDEAQDAYAQKVARLDYRSRRHGT